VRRGARAGSGIPTCAGLLVLALVAAACGGGDGYGAIPDPSVGPFDLAFTVTDSAGFPVVGAKVLLVPVGDVDQTPFTGLDVRAGISENRDEPLEDAVRLHGAGYLQGVSDATGQVAIGSVPDQRYFVFTQPAAADTEHLPGGSGCRQAMASLTLSLATTTIELSSRPGPAATYLGSTTCIGCHGSYAGIKTHAHRVGLAVPGQLTVAQDDSRYPQFEDGWSRFLPANSYTGGTLVWCYDYDASRGRDAFLTSLTDPVLREPGAVTYLKVWLWKDNGDGLYKITLENVHPLAGVPGPGDPPNPFTLVVALSYGGGLHQQQYLVAVPGRKGRYPTLQYNTEGQDNRFDLSRRQYRDFDLALFWDDATRKLRMPDPTRTFEGNCTGCHSTGFQRTFDAGTGEWLSTAVHDAQGALDLDADGNLDEINVGCEVCHGPGSEHATWAGNAAHAGHEGRWVVTPENLSPSREMLVCGRCHDGVLGNAAHVTGEPLDGSDRMPPPGVSRTEYLASYVTRKGPAAADLWSQQRYSRSFHQEYAELIRSRKARNDRLLVVCSDCHESHGNAPYRRHLRYDPDDAFTGLCFRCHGQELIPHMLDKTPDVHLGNAMRCWYCHMPQTAQSGAGKLGLLLGIPNGGPGDPSLTYWQNDLASHAFTLIPRKTHPDVAGELPGEALPIPYVKSCGLGCHNPAPLPTLPKIAPQSGGEER
jgi:hypothetical protein